MRQRSRAAFRCVSGVTLRRGPDRERHLDPPHDLWFDVVEHDLQAGDGMRGHAASLRPPQVQGHREDGKFSR